MAASGSEGDGAVDDLRLVPSVADDEDGSGGGCDGGCGGGGGCCRRDEGVKLLS